MDAGIAFILTVVFVVLLGCAFLAGHDVGICEGRCYPIVGTLHGQTCDCAEKSAKEEKK